MTDMPQTMPREIAKQYMSTAAFKETSIPEISVPASRAANTMLPKEPFNQLPRPTFDNPRRTSPIGISNAITIDHIAKITIESWLGRTSKTLNISHPPTPINKRLDTSREPTVITSRDKTTDSVARSIEPLAMASEIRRMAGCRTPERANIAAVATTLRARK
jgi:hypothetical protein